MIRFACSSCGQNLTASGGGAGRAVRCPQCGTRLEIPVVYQGGMPPIRSFPVVRPERAIIDVQPEPKTGLPVPTRSALSGIRETTIGERERDEGVLEEQELPRPRIPPGTKVAIFLLSFVGVVVVLAGALLLIRDAATKEVAARKGTERSKGTSSRSREISRNSREKELPYRRPVFQPPPIKSEENHNASARPAERLQLEKGKDGPVSSSPKDIEDSPRQGRELVPKLLPQRPSDSPWENGEAKPEMAKNNAEVARSAEAKEKPAKGYEPSCEAARTKLLKGFDTPIDALAKSNAPVEERLKRMDTLKKEKERFENSGWIPWSEPMRPHVDQYLNSLTAVQKNLHDAYKPLIDKELRARNDQEVDRLRAERKKRLDVKAMAKWRHIVNGNGPGVVHTLYSNGKINESEGDALWNYEQGVLTFRWPVPAAPRGFSVDQLSISSNGTSYEGFNIDKPERRPNLTGVYVLDALRKTAAK